MSKSMTVVLRGTPPSLNTFIGRNNVWEYREQKKAWTTAAWMMCRASKDRPSKPWEKAVVEITYFFADRRRHDADNYGGKFFLDGLTKAGVIVDDDLEHITTIIRGEYDKQNPRTQIVIRGE